MKHDHVSLVHTARVSRAADAVVAEAGVRVPGISGPQKFSHLAWTLPSDPSKGDSRTIDVMYAYPDSTGPQAWETAKLIPPCYVLPCCDER